MSTALSLLRASARTRVLAATPANDVIPDRADASLIRDARAYVRAPMHPRASVNERRAAAYDRVTAR